MTTPLGRKIARLVGINGPVSVADYFALCLGDPEYGYYQTRDPFGTAGDFTTAPEISQLFGEMIGVFLVTAWQAHGGSGPVRIVEIGPGRGTLMNDVQRVAARLAPGLASTATIELVETSERLRDVQRKTLQSCPLPVRWHGDIDTVEPGFTLLVANELLDALPVRQFVATRSGFRERMVSAGEDGELLFTLGAGGIDGSLLPGGAPPEEGAVFEISPAREALVRKVAERIAENGGTALFIDYGHARSGYGDTLQAMRGHGFVPVLETPGEADLTSHVDFERLTGAAGTGVLPVITQGQFLLGLGLLERAGALGSGKDETALEDITRAVSRLAGTGENEMGNLFKVMCIDSANLALPPFFADN